ncbi:Periplasmic component of amino acid ABC-type transporter/signal transduction system [Hyella patelloides LEGE 07179]|uniref:Periplasmic component of amino acid ABC-type transporter/signal transduction system n=1 Tax=Hyella patelloides LEGE 07179 TaxID=945734 RepID=A0A563VJG2_9CYAN|nr:Periplasmic component of amino acid ABC-type transporter/signal transduction system [Hyella patelloides LEGE 07179]
MRLNIFKHRRLLRLWLSGITILSTVLTTQLAVAETVMEKVSRTGVLTAGTSKDAFPFAYADNQGKLVGYSVDMLTLIQQQIEQELGRKIQLRLVALEPQARIPQLISNDVDIVCDASSFTWERDRKIDFSVSYGITGTRLLVKQSDYATVSQSLTNKKIGVLPGTTNELAIKRAEPNAQIVYVQDRNEGRSALEKGIIDAFADDDILLNSWLQNISNAENFAIAGYYSQEGIACMIPENNSLFLNNINYALVRFMQGFLEGKQTSVILFDNWFGDRGKVSLTRDLRDLMLENMQLIVDFKEEISPQ